MKDQNKEEKELVSKIMKLSKELKTSPVFKLPEKGPLPVKGNTPKEKEYLECIKKYSACLKLSEKMFAIPRKSIDEIDRKIRSLHKKFNGNNRTNEEDIFDLKKEENLINKEIEDLEIKLGLTKKEPKNKALSDLAHNLGKKMKETLKKTSNKVQKEIQRIKQKTERKKYTLSEDDEEFLEKFGKEYDKSLKEIDIYTEFIYNHCQKLLDSIEKNNEINFKKLADLEKRIDIDKSLSELTAGPGVDNIGATMPYTRYDSDEATLGGGASIVISENHDQYNTASQASKQTYVKLPSSGAYLEWTMRTTGRGVTMRFTLPDSSDGMGLSGSLDVYVNDNKVKTVDLTSYYMWQYFPSGNPQDSPGGAPCFAFDEVHFLLDSNVNSGDRIKIQSTGANGLEYGVDFIEVEEVGDPIGQPENSLNVCDYGANPNDDQDDYNAIHACIQDAASQGKNV